MVSRLGRRRCRSRSLGRSADRSWPLRQEGWLCAPWAKLPPLTSSDPHDGQKFSIHARRATARATATIGLKRGDYRGGRERVLGNVVKAYVMVIAHNLHVRAHGQPLDLLRGGLGGEGDVNVQTIPSTGERCLLSSFMTTKPKEPANAAKASP